MIEINVPPSKSQTMRALAFSCFGKSKSKIINPLKSPDVNAMIFAIEKIGASVSTQINSLVVDPLKCEYNKVINVDAGNSGLVLRFMTALGALGSNTFRITGDTSIQKNRPIKQLITALQQLGAKVAYQSEIGHPPIIVKGPISPGIVKVDGADSQPISALLMAASFLNMPTTIYVKNPGERPWIDLTIHWIHKLGGRIVNENYEKYIINKKLKYNGFEYSVPGDFSSAAFPIVASIIKNSFCTIGNLNFDDKQGDKKLIDILIQMGANIKIDKSKGSVTVSPSKKLKGGTINANDIIDSVPILAVLGCFCSDALKITNCEIARFKESNRIDAITKELKKMGANINSSYDSLTVAPSNLKTARVESHDDHRIAMALCVAASSLRKKGFEIDNTKCVEKSYPNFFDDLKKFEKK